MRLLVWMSSPSRPPPKLRMVRDGSRQAMLRQLGRSQGNLLPFLPPTVVTPMLMTQDDVLLVSRTPRLEAPSPLHAFSHLYVKVAGAALRKSLTSQIRSVCLIADGQFSSKVDRISEPVEFKPISWSAEPLCTSRFRTIWTSRPRGSSTGFLISL